MHGKVIFDHSEQPMLTDPKRAMLYDEYALRTWRVRLSPDEIHLKEKRILNLTYLNLNDSLKTMEPSTQRSAIPPSLAHLVLEGGKFDCFEHPHRYMSFNPPGIQDMPWGIRS